MSSREGNDALKTQAPLYISSIFLAIASQRHGEGLNKNHLNRAVLVRPICVIFLVGGGEGENKNPAECYVMPVSALSRTELNKITR